jgi:hypothetical protein
MLFTPGVDDRFHVKTEERGLALPGAAISGLNATGGLGKSSHLTGALRRSGREQLVNLLQLKAGVLANFSDHRSDVEFHVIVSQIMNNLPVLVCHFLDSLGFGKKSRNFLVP